MNSASLPLPLGTQAACYHGMTDSIAGGIGTQEELSEMICWSQLGIHRKPVGLVSTLGFYDHLLAHFDHCVATGFLKERYSAVWCSAPEPRELLNRLEAAAPAVPEGFINTWRPFPAGLAAQVELEELEAYEGFAK